MLEDALKTLCAADAPPARDLAFEIAVMARIERRRFHRALARNTALMLAAALVMALAMPALAPLWQAGLTAGSRMVGLPAPLFLGLVLTAGGATLPWWRRVI